MVQDTLLPETVVGVPPNKRQNHRAHSEDQIHSLVAYPDFPAGNPAVFTPEGKGDAHPAASEECHGIIFGDDQPAEQFSP